MVLVEPPGVVGLGVGGGLVVVEVGFEVGAFEVLLVGLGVGVAVVVWVGFIVGDAVLVGFAGVGVDAG